MVVFLAVEAEADVTLADDDGNEAVYWAACAFNEAMRRTADVLLQQGASREAYARGHDAAERQGIVREWELKLGVARNLDYHASMAAIDKLRTGEAMIDTKMIRVKDAYSPAFGLDSDPLFVELTNHTSAAGIVGVTLSRHRTEVGPTDSDFRSAGRALGLALARFPGILPVGRKISSATCKVLLNQAHLIDWKDLEGMEGAPPFNAISKLMEAADAAGGVSEEVFQEFIMQGFDPLDDPEVCWQTTARVQLRPRFYGHRDADTEVLKAHSDLPLSPQWTGPPDVSATTAVRYVKELVRKLLLLDLKDQAAALRAGIRDMVGAEGVLAEIKAEHGDCAWRALQGALAGAEDIELEAWKRVVTVSCAQDVTEEQAQTTVSLFWEAVGELDGIQRLQLCFFWAARAVPLGGIAALSAAFPSGLCIRVCMASEVDGPTRRLPRSATCFGQLQLAATEELEDLRHACSVAVAAHRYFGNA